MAIDRPDAFKAIVQLAPFADFAMGTHPAYHMAKTIYKYYPRVEVCPPIRAPAPYMKHYYEDPLQVTEGSTAASIMAIYDLKAMIDGGYKSLKLPMHVTVGDSENIVSRAALIRITKEAESEFKEYFEYPGVNHYVLNDGIWMDEMVANQLDFVKRVLE